MSETDWHRFVRERLGGQPRASVPSEEVIAELAEHLEDVYQDARRRGLSHEAAMASTKEQTSDWRLLAERIRRARAREDVVSHTAKTIWVPGISVLFFASLLLLAMTRLMPPTAWASPHGPWLVAVPWLCAYLVFGALGAWWSYRAGGSMSERFFSGVFPAALHLAIFVTGAAAAMIGRPWSSEYRQLAFLATVFLRWVMIPGAALALGTLPFLRGRSGKAVPAAS
ncbi:MAG TPA: hypothetical protein VKG84_11615 [Candidatus Acidoferrales bacterium]|nr:hypothetical protein [Candidatus Acidoferrales bacterium]